VVQPLLLLLLPQPGSSAIAAAAANAGAEVEALSASPTPRPAQWADLLSEARSGLEAGSAVAAGAASAVVGQPWRIAERRARNPG